MGNHVIIYIIRPFTRVSRSADEPGWTCNVAKRVDWVDNHSIIRMLLNILALYHCFSIGGKFNIALIATGDELSKNHV